VNLAPDDLYQRIEMRHLFCREWSLVERHARFVASGTGLSIAPSSASPDGGLSGHSRLVRLHANELQLDGQLRCLPRSLPFEDDSMQLVVARHVTDCLGRGSGIEAELARVVAPGGLLMVFGFNPVSSWRPWWSARIRDGLPAPRFRSARSMRRMLAEQDLSAGRSEFLGGVWPSSLPPDAIADARSSGAFWHGVWLLTARKQRFGMRPVSPLSARRRVGMNPGLLQSSSRRIAS